MCTYACIDMNICTSVCMIMCIQLHAENKHIHKFVRDIIMTLSRCEYVLFECFYELMQPSQLFSSCKGLAALMRTSVCVHTRMSAYRTFSARVVQLTFFYFSE